MYKPRRQPRLSQTFLKSRTLVRKLVRQSSIGPNDLVLEIGPGEGIITRELLKVASRVIAVELDPTLYTYLKRNVAKNPRLQLIHGNALKTKPPQASYKVFANIPFAIEGKIVRRLLSAANPPTDAYLVMRREVAQRLGGIYQNNLFSIMHQPWFRFQIFHRFDRRDFSPAPLVQPVMLQISKRKTPLLPLRQRRTFRQFVTAGFTGGRRLKHNLRPLFSPKGLNHLGQRYGFSPTAKPSELTVRQWIELFQTTILLYN